jgi:hypothetical protein
MKTAIVLLASVFSVIIASCSLSRGTEGSDSEATACRINWVVTPLDSASNQILLGSRGLSSSDCVKASRTFLVSSSGRECSLEVYGSKSVILDRVKDPFFGLLDIEDPQKGISYHDSLNVSDPSVQEYLHSLQQKKPSDSIPHKRSDILVIINGISTPSTQQNRPTQTSARGISGYSTTGSFSCGAGGWYSLNWGWLFFGLRVGTALDTSTPKGKVSCYLYHQPVWLGDLIKGPGIDRILTSQLDFVDYIPGWWNYYVRWVVSSTSVNCLVLYGYAI